MCTVPSVKRSKGKVVLNVGGFTPKPARGFFNLAFAVVTKAKKTTTVVIDGQRGAKWLKVSTVKLKHSSRIKVRLRDRGYELIRVRASSSFGKVCRGRAPTK